MAGLPETESILDWVSTFLYHWEDSAVPPRDAAKAIISVVQSSYSAGQKIPLHLSQDPKKTLRRLGNASR